MGKIRDGILNCLSNVNGPILLNKEIISNEKKYIDSPLNNVLEIKLKDGYKIVKCFWCNKENTNWCWNCEKPHCDDHARAIFIPRTHLINTFCLECSEELEKLIKKSDTNE